MMKGSNHSNEPPDIKDRTLEYAVRAVNLYRYIKARDDGAGAIVGTQYLRSATSIGANMVEAHHGESRKDFIHKCAIAQKEARESRYWLSLLSKSGLVAASRLEPLINETDQILAILTKIILNAKRNARA